MLFHVRFLAHGQYAVVSVKLDLLTLVVLNHISQMIATTVVCFSHGHRVVSEVDIAIVTKEFRHVFG